MKVEIDFVDFNGHLERWTRISSKEVGQLVLNLEKTDNDTRILLTWSSGGERKDEVHCQVIGREIMSHHGWLILRYSKLSISAHYPQTIGN